MELFERIKPRCTIKQKRVILICFIPLYYVAMTLFYVTTSSNYINHLTGAYTYIREERHKSLQKYSSSYIIQRLALATHIHDRTFINVSIFQTPKTENNQYSQKLMISWLNKPDWLNLTSANNYLSNVCPYSNCKMTVSIQYLETNAALIFDTKEKLPNLSRSLFYRRPSNQVWVFFQMEPPPQINIEWFRNKLFQNSMNWSWSYRLSSDIFRPYGTLEQQNTIVKRDYAAIFKRKTKMVAWVVSHCHTQSLREKFVSRLINEGIQVDIFGFCSTSSQREESNYIQKKISEEYKFYLSFENSFCEDYITEKFFTYYGLDVVLIVRGGINYARYFDKSTFIDTADFDSVTQLASFILQLDKSERSYTHYLRNKDRYIPSLTQKQTIIQSTCQLCEKLNNLDKFNNIYYNIETYVNNRTCFEKYDL